MGIGNLVSPRCELASALRSSRQKMFEFNKRVLKTERKGLLLKLL